MSLLDYGINILPMILICLTIVISYSVGRLHERYIYKSYLKDMIQKCEACATLHDAVTVLENTTDERYTHWRNGDSYPS